MLNRYLNLVNAGNIRVELMGIYSDKHKSFFDLSDNAKIAIVNDSSNEYRALILLSKTVVVKLKQTISPHIASIRDVETYIKPINLVELICLLPLE